MARHSGAPAAYETADKDEADLLLDEDEIPTDRAGAASSRPRAPKLNHEIGQQALLRDPGDVPAARPVARETLITFSDPTYEPPVLPNVAAELLALFRQPDLGLDSIVPAIESDPMIAGQVMKSLELLRYGAGHPARTLQEASVRLGTRGLTNVVWESAMHARVFRAKGYEHAMRQLRVHSTVVAQVSRDLAPTAGVDPETAFLAGLLHDVGFAAGLLVVAEMPKDERPSLDALWPALAQVHERVAGIVTRLWGLPEEICEAACLHHHVPDFILDPLRTIMIVAEEVAWEADASLCIGPWAEGFDRSPGDVVEAACAALQLDDARLTRARKRAAATKEELGNA